MIESLQRKQNESVKSEHNLRTINFNLDFTKADSLKKINKTLPIFLSLSNLINIRPQY